MPHRTSQILWVVENNSQCGAREVIAGVTAPSKPDIIVALHRIDGAQRSTAGRIEYKPGSISKSTALGGRALLALQLIRKVRPQKGVIVSGTSYGSDRHFTDALPSTGLDFTLLFNCDPVLSFRRNHAPRSLISDHVTSHHANYVIDRYRQIPLGENWRSITEMMTNYAGLERTHSNIYRRLKWEEASITIGNYRKSMIIHPFG